MWLFDVIGDLLETTVDTMLDKIEDAVDWACDKIDQFADWIDGLGNKQSFSGTSTKEYVDTEKELATFKEKITKEASALEEASIQAVSKEFDDIINYLRCHYPNLTDKMSRQKQMWEKNLYGTISAAVNKRVSENNPEFRKVLAMHPGEDKKRAIRDKMNEFLVEAKTEFDDKIEAGMTGLNRELTERLQDELEKKRQELNKQERLYHELEKKAKDGEMDLQDQQNELTYFSELETCLKSLFAEEGVDA